MELTPTPTPTHTRPRSGSWLDVNAKKSLAEFESKHGHVEYDRDELYLAMAAQIAERRNRVARQLGISDRSAQIYFPADSWANTADHFAEVIRTIKAQPAE